MAKQPKIVYKEKKFQPFWWIVRPFGKLVFKKPLKVINLAGEIEKRSIILPNHSAKSGPPALHFYFPNKTAQWGAYEMLGTYKMRKAYLRDILNIKKLKRKPGLKNSFGASVMGFLSLPIYRALRIIPSFPDTRFSRTLKYSEECLQKDLSIIVYAEDSNDGYKDVLTNFFPGFVMLAEYHYKKTGEDLPVYPVYYSVKKKRIMVIGKPLYVHKMVEEGLNRQQIADVYCNEVNKLYFEYVENAPDASARRNK